MEHCVMTPGTMKMPLWSADSWDSHNMVSTRKGEHKSYAIYKIIIKHIFVINCVQYLLALHH